MIFNLEKHGESTALVTPEMDEISYQDLVSKINKFSSNLEPEKHIALCIATSCPEFIVSYLGFLNSGIVPLLLYERLNNYLLKKYIETYTPKYLWLPKNITLNDSEYRVQIESKNSQLYKRKTKFSLDIHTDLATLATTSGSTGSKKLVRQTRQNLESNAHGIKNALQLQKSLSTITTLPLNYTFGISIIHSHFLAGATIHLTNFSIAQKQFWELVKESDIGIIYGVPVTFDIFRKLKIDKLELPKLKAFAQAGGKLTQNTREYILRYCQQNYKSFHIMYGQAEATTRISSFDLVKKPEKFESVGKPLMDCHLSVSKSSEVASKSEVIFYGPNVCMGYANTRRDLNLGDQWNGELRTGDLGYLDNDGYLYITGRLKRMIKIFGHSVSLDQLEETLQKEFGINIACLQKNDVLLVFTERPASKAQIVSAISSRTGLSSSEFKIAEISTLPRTDTGKKNYLELEKIEIEIN
jgi:acyl-CoA synthetase (AMP-forming)/AMP-acid ligase II